MAVTEAIKLYWPPAEQEEQGNSTALGLVELALQNGVDSKSLGVGFQWGATEYDTIATKNSKLSADDQIQEPSPTILASRAESLAFLDLELDALTVVAGAMLGFRYRQETVLQGVEV